MLPGHLYAGDGRQDPASYLEVPCLFVVENSTQPGALLEANSKGVMSSWGRRLPGARGQVKGPGGRTMFDVEERGESREMSGAGGDVIKQCM